MHVTEDHSRLSILTAALLALAVVVLGTYVRLADAGLGCPDWPGCYGHLAVPAALAGLDPASAVRAWIEMIHRYAAATLGVALLFLAWRHGHVRRVRPLTISLIALLLVQALLGMWTVTWKLMPLVVMAHLLGGLAMVALLWHWHLDPFAAAPRDPRTLGIAALLALVIQIALGGWTSANYAAVACPDLPTCQGQWWPDADFAHAFTLPSPIAGSYAGGGHDGAARTAIHFVHRLGALLVCVMVGLFVFARWRDGGQARRAGLLLAAALLIQIAIGLANVWFHLPLPLAVAHTAGAALLLLALITALRTTITEE